MYVGVPQRMLVALVKHANYILVTKQLHGLTPAVIRQKNYLLQFYITSQNFYHVTSLTDTNNLISSLI